MLPDYYLNPLGYDPLDIFRHELAHCNGWPANHPDTPMFSRPPQSQTHYLSTGPIGNENELTIMTDKNYSNCCRRNCLEQVSEAAREAMSIATLMPVTTVLASAKDMLLQSYGKKTASRACTTQQGLSIVLTF